MKNINLVINNPKRIKLNPGQHQPAVQCKVDHLSKIKLLEYSRTQSTTELEIFTFNGLAKH
jgi:hypothetical protein